MSTLRIQRQPATMLYLVGLARANALAGFRTHGIMPDASDSAFAITIDAGGTALDAIVVDVSADMFLGDDAECRLQDVAWLRPYVERHEAIIREACVRDAVMPVGFGSVFSGQGALEQSIAAHAESVQAFVEHTRNCDEWSLRAWMSRDTAVKHAETRIAREHRTSAGDGSAYLRARKLAGEAEAHAEQRALELVEQCIEGLGSTIVDATERRAHSVTQDPDRWLVAHVALLIDRHARAECDAKLDEHAARLEAEGIELELSGPWSPYSFCPVLGADPEAN